MNNNAYSSYSAAKDAGDQSRCAAWVRQGLEAGGINTAGHPIPARLYGPYLTKWGFDAINTNKYLPGDIAVFQGYPGGTADPVTGLPYGHIEMYSGSQWISVFKQLSIWPGQGYIDHNASFQIYRWPGQ